MSCLDCKTVLFLVCLALFFGNTCARIGFERFSCVPEDLILEEPFVSRKTNFRSVLVILENKTTIFQKTIVSFTIEGPKV